MSYDDLKTHLRENLKTMSVNQRPVLIDKIERRMGKNERSVNEHSTYTVGHKKHQNFFIITSTILD